PHPRGPRVLRSAREGAPGVAAVRSARRVLRGAARTRGIPPLARWLRRRAARAARSRGSAGPALTCPPVPRVRARPAARALPPRQRGGTRARNARVARREAAARGDARCPPRAREGVRECGPCGGCSDRARALWIPDARRRPGATHDCDRGVTARGHTLRARGV